MNSIVGEKAWKGGTLLANINMQVIGDPMGIIGIVHGNTYDGKRLEV